MLKSGLVSVSFRGLKCEEIIALTLKADLKGIEWGGDVHVPADNPENARAVGEMTRKAGLIVTSYGSYYRLGEYGDAFKAEFTKVLHTAKELGAPVIRLWAGTKGSAETPPEKRKAMVNEGKNLSQFAKNYDIILAFECHNNTLTDDFNSTLRLMEEIGEDNVKMYWQPSQFRDESYNLQSAEAILPYLVHTHVFNWPNPRERKPLDDAREIWLQYLDIIEKGGNDGWCLLEFMPNDMPEALPGEAKTLNGWLAHREKFHL